MKQQNEYAKKQPVTASSLGKVPPQAIEAEKAILGALMLQNDALPNVLPILQKPCVFYMDAHAKIYSACLELNTLGSPIDIVTVTEQLVKNGNFEIVGGGYYLATLTSEVVNSGNITAHAAIVIEKYIQREIIRVGYLAASMGYDDSIDPFDLLVDIERDLHEIGQIVSTSSTVHISKAGEEVVKKVDKIVSGEIASGGITSGIASIDEVTGGWQDTDLIIIAARPAVGKTAFVLNLVINSGVPCLIFSLEMGKEQLYKRTAANTGNIPLDFINSPKRMNEYYLGLWHAEYTKLSKRPIYINDKAGISVTEIRAITAEHKRKYGIKMIVIDYLQLSRASIHKNGNREQEIAQITRDLKAIAKDFEMPVIALSQLNRGIETRSNNKPTLSDLRESGAIEQDADLVCFLYGSNAEDMKGFRNLDIAKHRNGVTSDMLLKFEGAYQRFSDKEAFPFTGTQVPDNPRAGI